MSKNQILIVEDNKSIAAINKEAFEMEGYEVFVAENLKGAREILKNRFPDIIVLDIMLPDGSGFDLCHEIREKTDVPILFLSALSDKEKVVYGLKLGGDDYLTKPYRLDELCARVEVLTRRNREKSSNSDQISLGRLTLDFIARIAYIDGENAFLKSKEFGLLAALIQRMDRFVSPQELYSIVWGQNDNNDLRTIRVHISQLRHKLKIDDESPYQIIYAHKQGYRFVMNK